MGLDGHTEPTGGRRVAGQVDQGPLHHAFRGLRAEVGDHEGDTVTLSPIGQHASGLVGVPDSVVEADITAEGPDGPVSFSLSDGLLRIQDTTRVGFYEVRAADQQVRFAANLLSPSESNVAPRSELGLSDRPASAVASTANVGRREYWRSLLWLALVVLMVEWFAWHRRRSA